MDFNSPISSIKANRIIQLLKLASSATVLDVGCGNGEFLIRVLEAWDVNGGGIDINPDVIAAAREKAIGRVPAAAIEFHQIDVQQAALDAGSFDLAICMGSTHAFGLGETAFPNALQTLSRCVRPGGQLLIGEGYWKQPPAAEYLQLIGDPLGIYHDHAGNISFAEQQGLIPLYASVSNTDEWDHFEWSHRMKIECEAAANPDDPTMVEKLKRSRMWRDGYLRWGRTTMGFGFYLFMKPASA